MRAGDRFRVALGQRMSETLYREGYAYVGGDEVARLAREHGADGEARALLRNLEDRGLFQREGDMCLDGEGLVLRYEEEDNRRQFWQRNHLRRELLRVAGDRFDQEDDWLQYPEDEYFTDAASPEPLAAAQILQALGLLELQAFSGAFMVRITPTGHELLQDEVALVRQLPISAADDEEGHAAVAADALAALITGVEDLLKERHWDAARRELRAGDGQFDDGHWDYAVREYYKALESGLKYRLKEAGVSYGKTAALRDLARTAAQNDLLPRNYQGLFGFTDSIRSPRSHGAGDGVVEVDVGPAEALLMGNHVRSLLLYLGHRPS